MSFKSLNNSGFTLIELMISMAILAMISLGIYEATTNTFKLREDLAADGEFYTGIRLAMGILGKDVTLIYSPLIMTAQPAGGPSPTPSAAPNPAAKQALAYNADTNLSQSYTFWQAAADKTGLRPSHFIGKEQKMSFISASNYRIYRDSPESEFAKITYEFVKDEETAINGFKVPDSMVLRRGTNSDAFENDDFKDKEETHVYALLHGVVKGTFFYYRWQDNKLEKFTTWDSDTEDFQNQIPDIIEVVFDVKGPSQMSYSGDYRFKPEIPIRGIFPSF